MLDTIVDILRDGVLITGLVIIMMMMIEFINVSSSGKMLTSLKNSKFGGVLLGALLGSVPGCLGGFATVSLYSHKMLSMGALIAMMIASSGDEAFVMLAMIPKDAAIVMLILFVVAIASGIIVDWIGSKKMKKSSIPMNCEEEFEVHQVEKSIRSYTLKNLKSGGWRRFILLTGVALFIVALAMGTLGHEHSGHEHHHIDEVAHPEIAHKHTEIVEHDEGVHIHDVSTKHAELQHAESAHHNHGISILDEYWINLLFAIASLFVLYFLAVCDEHLLRNHIWDHVICRHLLTIFCWTVGALLLIEVLLNYLDLHEWISSNTALILLIAILVGIIPESGPHMLFVTLFASGAIPLSVLIASSISQDGHASLPLLAESKISFLQAKLINCLVAALVGYGLYIFGL